MEISIEFGSRKILNAHLDLEEKIIQEIFILNLHQVYLTDISDIYQLQDIEIIQEKLILVFNLTISLDELQNLTMGQLVDRITNG